MENNQKELILIEDLGRIYPKETSKQKTRYGLYKCFCGNEFKSTFQDIKSNHRKSCGCLKNIGTHKLTNHRLYRIYDAMNQRVYNKNSLAYKNYGNRGITICNEWRNDFLNFYNWAIKNGYQDNLSIDRIDNDKGYSPDNCRWTKATIQRRNTRMLRKTNTSGYRGVSYISRDNKWKAQICVNNIRISLGAYFDKIEAAKAYNNYVIINKLEHTLNIIKED